MNHSTLKKFAAKARVDLIEQVGARLRYVLNSDSVELREKSAQVKQLREALKLESEKALVERVAYLWFNRLAALRFMDAEGRHPFGCRVVTATPGNTQPELLQLARNGTFPEGLNLNTDRVNDLLDGKVPSSNAQAEVYRMLVMAVCNFYHQLMPFVFEKIADYTELLLPEDLLSEASLAAGFRSSVADEDCVEVELIGWLYQYYISEKKDAVMARKKAVPKEDIPAVTQLFTPHWIVRYMVENSLGRLWMQSRPSSRLTEKMPYYIADVESNADAIDVGELKVSSKSDKLTVKSPEEIRLIDPACGSGHILTYAFDLLYAIYEEEGYEPSSIPGHILTKNLHGVEIDERAAELAYFALMMKAQQHYGRFLRRQLRADAKERIVPAICCLEEVHFNEGELKEYMDALDVGDLFTAPVLTLMHQFEEAKNHGSLIEPAVEDTFFLRDAITNKDLGGELFLRETHRKVETVLRQAEILSPRYHVAVLNPPYMNKFNGPLKSFVEEKFKDYKSDLFASFIIRSKALTIEAGLLGLMTPFVWMFISSYEKLRANVLNESTLTSLIQLEYSGFDGATVPICTFTILNRHLPDYKGGFVRLSDFRGTKNQSPKTLEAIRNPECGWFFRASATDFKKIPGLTVAYWLSDKAFNVFAENKKLGELCDTANGMLTTDNDRFLRFWHEVSFSGIRWDAADSVDAELKRHRWFPHNKGGAFRKWWGNQDYIVDWEENGRRIKETVVRKYPYLKGNPNFVVHDDGYYFKSAISWSEITSSSISFRYYPLGFTFNYKGMCAFENGSMPIYELLAYCNSSVVLYFTKAINPSLSFGTGNFRVIPGQRIRSTIVEEQVCLAIDIAKVDWNNFETSWDFQYLPLLREELKSKTLSETWANWDRYCKANIDRMKELEEENNRLWIDAYGLQDELPPEVPEKEITLARADPKKDVAAFISYAIGCMFGRYSLDKPGLVLANAGETVAHYVRKVKSESDPSSEGDSISFMPDDDNIIPILDAEWFEDDIVARFREFLKVTFGEATLTENIQFIEDSLGKDLRKYFATDFYKDHLQTYKKRPIYWLFQSPKKSFQALIYLHRYNRDTVNLLLNDYLREFQNKLQNRRKHLDEILASESTSARDKTAATKEQNKIAKTLPELADWERDVILPLAQKRLEIDLDDGVKVNYPKFGKALANITGVS